MRHNKKVNHLGRTKAHREAMLANMASSLIKHKRIFTTTAKAKSLRKYIEPLITKSKDTSVHSQRIVFSSLQDKYAVKELFTESSRLGCAKAIMPPCASSSWWTITRTCSRLPRRVSSRQGHAARARSRPLMPPSRPRPPRAQPNNSPPSMNDNS